MASLIAKGRRERSGSAYCWGNGNCPVRRSLRTPNHRQSVEMLQVRRVSGIEITRRRLLVAQHCLPEPGTSRAGAGSGIEISLAALQRLQAAVAKQKSSRARDEHVPEFGASRQQRICSIVTQIWQISL